MFALDYVNHSDLSHVIKPPTIFTALTKPVYSYSVNGKLTESSAYNMIFIYHTLIMGYFISSKLLVNNSIKVEQLSGPFVTLNS